MPQVLYAKIRQSSLSIPQLAEAGHAFICRESRKYSNRSGYKHNS